MTLLDEINGIDGDDLFDHGIENPCAFWSRGMYEDTNGYPPCFIRIGDAEAFAIQCVKKGVEPIDYIRDHVEGVFRGEQPLPFTLECECPSCTESDEEDPRIDQHESVAAYDVAPDAERDGKFKLLQEAYQLGGLTPEQGESLQALVDDAIWRARHAPVAMVRIPNPEYTPPAEGANLSLDGPAPTLLVPRPSEFPSDDALNLDDLLNSI